ncbi:NAD(P)-binding protein [Acrodontium crateriforme]|uniref:NAD(P)-binding protein n=1 Tax=Acrodontium crateriforme TaxID=150365 RepID=A0AAQ3M5B5_9PEZI|nr:NAD(P)-binding protein [Acrodontium crateriforme]
MTLTVLGDKDVNRILHNLTREDVLWLQECMADALHWYSTSNDANDCCSDFQPERTVLKRKDGSTTLFMPASGMMGQGIKVVNVVPPDTTGLPSLADQLSLNSESSRSSLSGGLSGSPRSSLSMSRSSTTVSSTTSLPISSNSGDSSSTVPTSISSGNEAPNSNTATIRGSLTLLDNNGNTTGLINAEELTAFRTALCSTMLLRKRSSVHDMTVFGAGKQAYWHIRLAMLLRPEEIHHLNIVTRNFESARQCLMRLYNPLPEDPDYINQIGEKHNSKTKKTILTPSHTEYQRLLKEYVRASNVIFCTTPSQTPLFPATYLTNPEGRKKGRYIACIGSYKPHMIELHPDVLRYAVAPHHEHKHIHKRQKEGGAIIVDTVSGCLKEAGEVIQAKLQPDQVVELGELFMLKREAERKMAAKGEMAEKGCQFQENSGMKEWMTKGNVIYKSVGLGLMDVVVGNELLAFAREKNVGTTIHDF